MVAGGSACPRTCEDLDDLPAERGEIVRLAAADQRPLDLRLAIDPRRTGVVQVGLEARLRRERAAVEDARVGEDPGTVTDHPDRLGAVEALAHEAHRTVVGPQLVGVGDATR